MSLYTKAGRPLQVVGDAVFTAPGKYVGQRVETKVFGPNGRYVGTVVGNRLVFRLIESAHIGPSSSVEPIPAQTIPDVTAAIMWGDEPSLPD
ncbi:hypothetical protein [Limnoglobus roseus]|uniref:Uncharacterized protein n=1 Tax=Limnoglobus roseus TaxID=2598579 RepID=A0A5C1AFT1_9BACT|nr:hypothetical protein [Limnoglobus roseus]QEL18289.1 hypothetical protein PX52LOC_05308 [Limnoglobus roseus]